MKKIPSNITPVLAELRDRLKEQFSDRLVRLVLFGSRARGDNDLDSDIDVLAVLKGKAEDLPQLQAGTDIEVELDLKYGMLPTIFFIDEERYNHREGPFMRNVRREGVLVECGGAEDSFGGRL